MHLSEMSDCTESTGIGVLSCTDKSEHFLPEQQLYLFIFIA